MNTPSRRAICSQTFIPSQEVAMKAVEKFGTPLYFTDASVIRERVAYMHEAFAEYDFKVFYSIKANINPSIVKVIHKAGVYGIDAVSPFEVRAAIDAGFAPERVIFTPSNPSDEEMRYVGKLGALQNLGSVSEVDRFGKLFPKGEVSIRISPEVGAGEFAGIRTGQLETKFGITLEQIPEIKKIAKKHGLTIVGVHSHIGSGFYTTTQFKQSVEAVCNVARSFPDVRFLDFGGGFGVRYKPGEESIDLGAFARAVRKPLAAFEKDMGRRIEIRIEPGKFLVSHSTVLLSRVTTVKQKKRTTFVGLDVGFNTLIRPAMYGAYHHVVNMSRSKGTKKHVQVVGNVCETCDVFNKGIELVDPREGDILAILTAGGHASAMSSNYNGRPFIAEAMIDGNKLFLTRKRQSYEEMMEGFVK
jgi:diaminopimelate decarboxylase